MRRRSPPAACRGPRGWCRCRRSRLAGVQPGRSPAMSMRSSSGPATWALATWLCRCRSSRPNRRWCSAGSRCHPDQASRCPSSTKQAISRVTSRAPSGSYPCGEEHRGHGHRRLDDGREHRAVLHAWRGHGFLLAAACLTWRRSMVSVMTVTDGSAAAMRSAWCSQDFGSRTAARGTPVCGGPR